MFTGEEYFKFNRFIDPSDQNELYQHHYYSKYEILSKETNKFCNSSGLVWSGPENMINGHTCSKSIYTGIEAR